MRYNAARKVARMLVNRSPLISKLNKFCFSLCCRSAVVPGGVIATSKCVECKRHKLHSPRVVCASVSVWINITVGLHSCWGLWSSWKATQQQGRKDYSGQWMRQHAVKTRHLTHTRIYLLVDKILFISDSHDRRVLSVAALVAKCSVAITANQMNAIVMH